MRNPNAEQKKAIEHDGGVLLSAGAGSGKTFVLVEHIIYLLDQFIKKNTSLSDDELTMRMKAYLSGIVLMTFTRKAAGELALRLQKRIELQLSEGHSWGIALNAINSMFVGTIHGFCNRLIKQGFFVDTDSSAELISEIQYTGTMERLFERWYTEICKKKFPSMSSIYCLNKKSILDSIGNIFGDPSLRHSWRKITVAEMSEINLELFFQEYFEISGLVDLQETYSALSKYPEEKKKKWYSVLESFSMLPRALNAETFGKYLDFFNENKTLRAPSRDKGYDDIILLFDRLKELRSFLRENEESITSYLAHRNEIYARWCESLKDLMTFVEIHYCEMGGITFSDLEYIVAQGCSNEEVVSQINKAYHYFIVDEFQDTSTIQFTILKKILRQGLDKIFCVGDVKQAIYGFRGGELGVFLSCQEQIAQNMTMTNNYRSYAKIIDFNNVFFDYLFRMGPGFSGRDQHNVGVKYQTVPLERDSLGEIIIDRVNISDAEKLSSAQMVEVEAESIIKKINSLIEMYPGEEICILYRKLGPASILIEKLLSRGKDFTAQVKVSLEEDPIVGMAMRLLAEKLEETPCRNLTALLFNDYFRILGLKVRTSWSELLDQFYSELDTIGFVESFRRFVFSLGLSNSNYKNNFKILEAAEQISHGSLEKMWISLNDNSGKSYSIEFQKGESASKIRIMTTHASKGLEFDHVILGGIHNNGISPADRSYFGKYPGSFRWKSDGGQKKAYKSLQLILEEEIGRQKEFSESKRLFYVASTRAVKTLGWVDIYAQDKPCSLGKNSWINGIRALSEIFQEKGIEANCYETSIDEIQGANVKLPLFHDDKVGLSQCEMTDDRNLLIVSELSVTRLASIVHCPRKFYLQNICKIDSDFVEDDKTKREDGELDDAMRSSAERGINIHNAIASLIIEQSTDALSLEKIAARDRKSLNWIMSQLKKFYASHEMISERAMKFSLFGMMITGIPDLLVFSEKDKQVWDFKTGRYDFEKSKSYWFQLMVYAFASYGDKCIKSDEQITLVLAFVDEQECYQKRMTCDEIIAQLKKEWIKLGHLSQVNKDHCQFCQFSSLCMH